MNDDMRRSLYPRSDFSLSTLETIKAAWSSPSACIKANWCRIPAAVLIAFGLLFLFTFFCCCAQCLSCCCCRRSRQTPRGFGDAERGGGQSLLPTSSSFGQSDLPSMPSYAMSEYKKPTYAVIGDDGSVTTEDPAKRLRDDFPSPAYEASRPLFPQSTGSVPGTLAGNDIFANANSNLHSPQNESLDTSYNAGAPQYSSPGYQPSQISPTRRNMLSTARESSYSQGPPPSFTTLPRTGHEAPEASLLLAQPTSFNSSRGQFNEGGPFPIIGRRAVPSSRPLPQPVLNARSLPRPELIRPRSQSPPTTPYPVGSLREDGFGRTLRDDYEFDPYGQNNTNTDGDRFGRF